MINWFMLDPSYTSKKGKALQTTKFCNVFVENLSESTTKEDLEFIFGKYGEITSAVVMTSEDGKSKCFGFVNFEMPDAAAQAVHELNGQKFDDKEWYVGKALKKSERELDLRGNFHLHAREAFNKHQGINLYLKNFEDNIEDDMLRELFSGFGTITSCKIMREPNGASKGFGFVSFSAPEEAARALAEMNGKLIGGKPLVVALAQDKAERKAKLQPDFGLQQQLIPGMGAGGALMPNLFAPIVRQGQQRHRPSGRRARGAVQQMQQALIQQQMLPWDHVQRYAPGHNIPDIPMPGVVGGMISPCGMGGLGMQGVARSQPVPVRALTSALANATPRQQRMLLGEHLYPLVEQYVYDHAAKVTGMLLEMDPTEVLHLLEYPDALEAKVAEAMEVLRNVT
ncbi:polyadenylate-binding protein 4-like isoform X2 [Zingiber officinale]|uniref:polyadenylate-binding protein 4-like isoform X2 n=1 Tax=Zingiber officinale TaxID=94328 RepID=UPI001C4A7815|nr:polyadenylate-binding protein 4-like isoform X2 [Zingiber officinale]